MAASSCASSTLGSRGSSHASSRGGPHLGSSSSHTSSFKVYGSLFKVNTRYQFLNPLGKGSYGVVCAAKDRETGQCVAIKKVSPMTKRTVDAKHTLREVLLLQFLGKHPNIISIHNLSTNLKDDELYIVMDLMDTDMHRVIQSAQPLSDAHAKYFLHQLLRGVKYLHDNGVLHRDLKPGNLLLSKTCQLKIADFGLARKLPRGLGGSSGTLERPRSAPAASTSSGRAAERPPMTEHVVTRWYRAPELMLQPDGLYDQSVDMWSVGCIFAEILGRKALFPGKNFLHQLSLIFDVLGAPPPESTTRIQSSQAQRFLRSLGKKAKVPFRTLFPGASDAAVDLLDRLLEFDPEKRITAQDALAHPYMQDIERKYRHRGGGNDPPVSLRVDFSFDSKNLTKLDLRSLIVKEVDNLHKTLARGNSSSTTSSISSEVSRDQQSLPLGEKKSADSISTNSSAPNSSMSSNSAHLSKIHVGLRQTQEQEHGQHEHHLVSKSSNGTQRRHFQSVMLGSNRQRIRTTNKPPVPRQQLAGDSADGASNQHEQVRVVASQASLLADRSASRLETPPVHDLAPSILSTKASAEPSNALNRLPKPALETKRHNHSSPKEENDSAGTQAHPSLSDHTQASKAIESEQDLRAVLAAKVHTAAHTPFSGTTGDMDSSATIAAAIALGQRSKALIASLATSAKAPSTSAPPAQVGRGPSTFGHPQTAWKPSVDRNPESSSSSSSSSGSPPVSPETKELEATCRQYQQSLTRSNRPGSAMLLAKSKHVSSGNNRPEDHSTATANLVRPRRISSAGPTRSKQRQIAASGALTARRAGTTSNTSAAFVGSTSSLIRAQRSNTGQSLAESANSMLATISRSSNHPSPPHDSREEDAPLLARPATAGSVGILRHQRSSSQLAGADPTAKRLPTKRLTVPRSPKFSVMSWQKKREGNRRKVGTSGAVGLR